MVNGEPTEIAAKVRFVDMGRALDVAKVGGEENFEIIFSGDLADEDLLEVLLVDDDAELFFGFANDTFSEGFVRLKMAAAGGAKLAVHITGVGALLEKEFGTVGNLAGEDEIDSDMD